MKYVEFVRLRKKERKQFRIKYALDRIISVTYVLSKVHSSLSDAKVKNEGMCISAHLVCRRNVKRDNFISTLP
jgi:hypothetical protein